MRLNVNWRKYFDVTSPITIYYTEHYNEQFLKQCFNKIVDAKRNNKKQIDLIQFKDNRTVSTIQSSEYDEVVSAILTVSIHYQFYELCSLITDNSSTVTNMVM
jgi:hypothetical protein